MENTKLILVDYLGVFLPYEYCITCTGDRIFSYSLEDVNGLKLLKEANIDINLLKSDNVPLNTDLQNYFTEILTGDGCCSKVKGFVKDKHYQKGDTIIYITAGNDHNLKMLKDELTHLNLILYTIENADDKFKVKADYISHKKAGEGVLLEVANEILWARKNSQPDISFIIPAYNEERRIYNTLDRYYHYFENIELSFEIIVVLNGCRDNTLYVVDEFSKYHPKNRYLNIDKPIGKGGAIIEGFKIAKGKYVSFTDADGSTYAKELVGLLDNIGDYDGIIASRWLTDSFILVEQPWYRKILSRGFNLFVRIVLNLPFKDTQCGSKIFKSGIVKNIENDLNVSGFAFDACLLYHINKRGYRIKEHPIAWSDDRKSTLNVKKVGIDVFTSVIKTRLRDIFKNG